MTGTDRVKRGLAEMLRGGVVMDVVTGEQAKIAEDSGAVAVMALERVPADIRRDGGVARMSDPALIEDIKASVTIPVMAKCRIGHFVEAQVLQSLGVDFVDESEVLTPADEAHHVDKWQFTVPFVCGATNFGEALRRISEGAAMIRSKGEAGTGNIVEAVRHLRSITGDIRRITQADSAEVFEWAKRLQAPVGLVQELQSTGRLPVPLFCAGGISTPSDAALRRCSSAPRPCSSDRESSSRRTRAFRPVDRRGDDPLPGRGDHRQGEPRAWRTDEGRRDRNVGDAPRRAGLVASFSRPPGAPGRSACVAGRRAGARRASRPPSGLSRSLVRLPSDLDGIEAIVLPGGESTTMSRLLEHLRACGRRWPRPGRRIAGIRHLRGDDPPGDASILDGRPDQEPFGAIDITVRRNGYGRQVDSFECDLDVKGFDDPFHARVHPSAGRRGCRRTVDVLSEEGGRPAVCRAGSVLVCAFHPELADDPRLHDYFLSAVV